MPRPLAEATVVVTGASSGIGRAAALRFARRGARLALCSRDPESLAAAAAECEAAGSPGVVHRPLDVADEAAVEGLAAAAVERFGRIDVWVNDAGTIAYGSFLEVPPEVFRGVIETNLMGQVHGARAALARFAPQRSGVLVNVSSTWARVPSPYVSAYVASKHAVRAFTEALQAEVEGLPGVEVAMVTPAAVDTPIYANAANYDGREIRAIPLLLPVEDLARAIEELAETPRRERHVGRAGHAVELLSALAPPLYRRLAHPAFLGATFGEGRVAADPGNVLRPVGEHAAGGGWRRRRRGDLVRALLGAGAAALRGRSGEPRLVDTEGVEGPADRDDEQKGIDRAKAAEERSSRARGRAKEAHREAGRASSSEATEAHEREAEIHEEAVEVQEDARRLQEEHAREHAGQRDDDAGDGGERRD